MVYTGKIYGPYIRKDGRKHIIIVNKDSKITVSYPKYLIEEFIGRKLTNSETVDHFDRNINNDNISNLIIKERDQHIKDDIKRVRVKYICPICKKDVIIENVKASIIIADKKRGKSGPYCSKSCAGKGGSKYKTDIDIEYYNNKQI